jgi:DNA-binding MarR family transcriptional regulator
MTMATTHAVETAGTDSNEFIADVEQEITILLRRGRAVSGEMAREIHPDLDQHAYGLLHRLAEVGPCRPSDLAAHFGIGKATTSRQLACLEDLGLVSRQPDPHDGRAHLLGLTEEGRTRLYRVRAIRQLRMRQRIATWPQEDIATFARLLARFNQTLGQPQP